MCPPAKTLGLQVDLANRRVVQRLAVEAVGPARCLVIDARGDTRSASFGHIIATRIQTRGAAGLVTDGALRDSPASADLAMPSYFCAAHAATSTLMHFAVDMNVPIGCAGVLVMPGDVLAGDAEGVVAIPAAIANEVALDALEQEMAEASALGAGPGMGIDRRSLPARGVTPIGVR